MSYLNKVMLIGRLGRDPEVRFLENGTAVAKIAIATSESYKDKTSGEWIEQTEWHDVVLWRWLAERAEKQLKKGAHVYVEGKLKHRKYQKEGEETSRRISEIVADNFRLLSKRENSDNGYFPSSQDEFGGAKGNGANFTPQQNDSSPAVTTTATEEPADDLPF